MSGMVLDTRAGGRGCAWVPIPHLRSASSEVTPLPFPRREASAPEEPSQRPVLTTQCWHNRPRSGTRAACTGDTRNLRERRGQSIPAPRPPPPSSLRGDARFPGIAKKRCIRQGRDNLGSPAPFLPQRFCLNPRERASSTVQPGTLPFSPVRLRWSQGPWNPSLGPEVTTDPPPSCPGHRPPNPGTAWRDPKRGPQKGLEPWDWLGTGMWVSRSRVERGHRCCPAAEAASFWHLSAVLNSS